MRAACFNVTISGNFEHFQCFNFETNFLKNAKTLFKKLDYGFLVEILRLKTHHFHTKLSCQKPMLRQIEWGVQNRLLTKNGVLPVTTLFFRKFCLNLRTSYEELIWCTNTTQMAIFMLFESVGVLFEGAFSLWVSLSWLSFKKGICS